MPRHLARREPMPAVLDRCPCCLRKWTAEEQRAATNGVLQQLPDGRWVVAGPLGDLIAPHRVRMVLAMLEAAAVLRGDTNAASVYLAHIRWRQEMRKGKAPARVEVAHSGRVTVVADLGVASGKGGYVNHPTLAPRTIDAEALPE